MHILISLLFSSHVFHVFAQRFNVNNTGEEKNIDENTLSDIFLEFYESGTLSFMPTNKERNSILYFLLIEIGNRLTENIQNGLLKRPQD